MTDRNTKFVRHYGERGREVEGGRHKHLLLICLLCQAEPVTFRPEAVLKVTASPRVWAPRLDLYLCSALVSQDEECGGVIVIAAVADVVAVVREGDDAADADADAEAGEAEIVVGLALEIGSAEVVDADVASSVHVRRCQAQNMDYGDAVEVV